jgi:hypothetical protein
MITGTAVKKPVIISFRIAEENEIIKTLEGDMQATKGDYIITGVKGECYPCKPDIFDLTYKIIELLDPMENM